MKRYIINKVMIFFLSFFLIGVFSQELYAQKRERIIKNMELPVYKLTDPKVVDIFDSIILKDKKVDTISSVYISYIKKDTTDYMYLITIYKIPSFAIENTSSFSGLFYIRNIPFILTKGCNPESYLGNENNDPIFLFNSTSSKVNFSYYGVSPPLLAYVDPERWTFFYAYRSISYIEMPETLLDRMGFIPCE